MLHQHNLTNKNENEFVYIWEFVMMEQQLRRMGVVGPEREWQNSLGMRDIVNAG